MAEISEAEKAFAAKKFRLASDIFRQALEHEPNNPLLYQGLGRSLLRTGAYDEAILAAQKALELDSTLALPYVVLSYAYHHRKNSEGFRSAAIRAFQLEPNSEEVLVCYGTMLATDRDFEGAVSILEKVLQINPRDFAARNNLAITLLQKEDWKGYYEQSKQLFLIAPSLGAALKLAQAFQTSHKRLVGIGLLALGATALVFRAPLILLLPLAYGIYGFWISFRLLLLRQWKPGLTLAFSVALYLAVLYVIYRLIQLASSQ